jgi:adenylate kinase
MIRERLAQPDAAKGFILDGFPRNHRAGGERSRRCSSNSAKPLEAVVLLNLDLGMLFKRLTGRRICQDCGRCSTSTRRPRARRRTARNAATSPRLIQRPDDKEEVIGKRLEVYEAQTKPLIKHYRSRAVAQGRRCGRRYANGVREPAARSRRGGRRKRLDPARRLAEAAPSEACEQPLADFRAPPSRQRMRIAPSHRERLEFAARRENLGAHPSSAARASTILLSSERRGFLLGGRPQSWLGSKSSGAVRASRSSASSRLAANASLKARASNAARAAPRWSPGFACASSNIAASASIQRARQIAARAIRSRHTAIAFARARAAARAAQAAQRSQALAGSARRARDSRAPGNPRAPNVRGRARAAARERAAIRPGTSRRRPRIRAVPGSAALRPVGARLPLGRSRRATVLRVPHSRSAA